MLEIEGGDLGTKLLEFLIVFLLRTRVERRFGPFEYGDECVNGIFRESMHEKDDRDANLKRSGAVEFRLRRFPLRSELSAMEAKYYSSRSKFLEKMISLRIRKNLIQMLRNTNSKILISSNCL